MNRKSSRQLEDDRRLAERAAEWAAVLPDASPEERVEFIKWIKDSPLHLQEFLLASAVVRGLGQIDLAGLSETQDPAAARGSNVVHISPVERGNPTASPARRVMQWRLAAGIAVLAIVLSVTGYTWHASPKTYVTGIGEQRTIHLDDGSVLQLNVGSRVEVRITAEARNIRLLDGEAMFNVGRDPGRPFRVFTATNVIQALGTQFNVRRAPSGTTVSVIEGLVQISGRTTPRAKTSAIDSDSRSSSSAKHSAEKLRAGEEARIGLDGQIEQRLTIDVVTAVGWRHSRLDFRAERLIDIAAEFNRYNKAPQIEVQDRDIGTRRYSGVFDANNPRSLTDFLREDPEIALEDRGDVLVIRTR